MRLLCDLPVELCSDIISYALQVHPRPQDVLSVNSAFRDLGIPQLYGRLCFRSIRQLATFAKGSSVIPYTPKHIEVTLAGGAADFHIFGLLIDVFRRCIISMSSYSNTFPGTFAGGSPSLPLDSLSLCLNSHSSNPFLQHVYNAMRLVNPRRFAWLGPDPSHHFSIAIVPTATVYLFAAMGEWSRVEHVTLASISFPTESGLRLDFNVGRFNATTHMTTLSSSLIPPLPRLRTLYIGQAARLPPCFIATMLFLPGPNKPEEVRLVDAYKESIWGARLRRKDVEKAALSLKPDMSEDEVLERVRRIVKCEAKTERIIGGDRVEGTLLE